MANSETKMKNFVGLSRQYYWVPDAQKSTASSPNPLGPFSHPGSLFSRRAEPRLFDRGASYIYLREQNSDPPESSSISHEENHPKMINGSIF